MKVKILFEERNFNTLIKFRALANAELKGLIFDGFAQIPHRHKDTQSQKKNHARHKK